MVSTQNSRTCDNSVRKFYSKARIYLTRESSNTQHGIVVLQEPRLAHDQQVSEPTYMIV